MFKQDDKWVTLYKFPPVARFPNSRWNQCQGYCWPKLNKNIWINNNNNNNVYLSCAHQRPDNDKRTITQIVISNNIAFIFALAKPKQQQTNKKASKQTKAKQTKQNKRREEKKEERMYLNTGTSCLVNNASMNYHLGLTPHYPQWVHVRVPPSHHDNAPFRSRLGTVQP